MACFVVPMTEAVVTTVITKVVSKKESENMASEVTINHGAFSAKLKKLNSLLWGGSALLAFEHLWHGEIQPFFPFLTAASDAEAMSEVLHEMSTVGVGMAVFVTAVWGVMMAVSYMADKKAVEKEVVAEA